MEVNGKEQGRNLLLELKGELDHHGAKAAMVQIEFALDTALPKKLVLDFADVSFMDSSGIAVVLKAQRRMSSAGGVVSLKNVPPQAKKVFDTAGLTRLIAMEQGGNV